MQHRMVEGTLKGLAQSMIDVTRHARGPIGGHEGGQSIDNTTTITWTVVRWTVVRGSWSDDARMQNQDCRSGIVHNFMNRRLVLV